VLGPEAVGKLGTSLVLNTTGSP